MNRRRRSLVVPGALVLTFVAAWFFLAPLQLGGSTLYATTVGNSMEPRFHAGDLAVVRRAHSYRVGQVVLYESPVFHRAVLHRIIVIQHGRYFFQGDNNDFVDAGYATRGDLLGTLWFRVPRAGRLLSWIGKPAHSALVAAIGTLLLLLVGSRVTRRRLRRRRRRIARGERRDGAGRALPTMPILTRFRRPRRSLVSAAGLVTLVVGAAALAAGMARPATRVLRVDSFDSTGSFSYVGRASPGSSTAYPAGVARTGDPVFLDAVRNLNVSFDYRFRSTLPHDIRGSIVLRARLVDESSTWQHLYGLGRPTSFAGDHAAVSARVVPHDLTTTLDRLAANTGVPGASYTVELAPLVRITGTVAGKHISRTFAPTLPFTATDAVLKLDISPPATAPGATYAAPSAASLLDAALHPSQTGTLPKRVPNTLALAGSDFTPGALEIAGAMLVLAGAWMLVAGQVRRRREVWSPERRIAHRHGCDLFDVADLEEIPANTVVTPVADLDSLAGIARQAERPILRHVRGDVAVFVVDDPPRLYRVEREAHSQHTSSADRSSSLRRLPLPGRRTARVAGLITTLVLVVSVSSATFTAGNLVPASHASRSAFTRTLAQLLPSLCAGITPTNLVIATSSYTTGTSQSDLILGRNATGSQTLSGSGGNDCLVAGGGRGTTNTLMGGSGSGDVCLGAPGAVNNYSGCEIKGTS